MVKLKTPRDSTSRTLIRPLSIPNLLSSFRPLYHRAELGNTYGEELVNAAKEKMFLFWEEYKQAIIAQTPRPSHPSPSPDPLAPDPPAPPWPCKNMSVLTGKLNALAVQPARPSDEFRAYLEANPEFELAKLKTMQQKAHEMSKRPKKSANLPSNNLPKIPTVIQWWYEQRHTWPTLTKFAIEILSVAAMNDDVERVFSGARRTVSWEHARLGIDKIEAVECLDSWLPCKLEAMIDRLEDLQAGEMEEIGGDEVSERLIIDIEDIDVDERDGSDRSDGSDGSDGSDESD